jgi:hypothetical protein
VPRGNVHRHSLHCLQGQLLHEAYGTKSHVDCFRPAFLMLWMYDAALLDGEALQASRQCNHSSQVTHVVTGPVWTQHFNDFFVFFFSSTPFAVSGLECSSAWGKLMIQSFACPCVQHYFSSQTKVTEIQSICHCSHLNCQSRFIA